LRLSVIGWSMTLSCPVKHERGLFGHYGSLGQTESRVGMHAERIEVQSRHSLSGILSVGRRETDDVVCVAVCEKAPCWAVAAAVAAEQHPRLRDRDRSCRHFYGERQDTHHSPGVRREQLGRALKWAGRCLLVNGTMVQTRPQVASPCVSLATSMAARLVLRSGSVCNSA
jgi:hypothetical protein